MNDNPILDQCPIVILYYVNILCTVHVHIHVHVVVHVHAHVHVHVVVHVCMFLYSLCNIYKDGLCIYYLVVLFKIALNKRSRKHVHVYVLVILLQNYMYA